MSTSEILEELPKLTCDERLEIVRRIREIDGENEDIALCVANAEEGFLMLDQLEAEDDARRAFR
jgi:hypothetical protein